MKKTKKDYLFIVRTTEDTDGIPGGSGIYVERETKRNYYGKWSSMGGTFKVSVRKDKCKKLDKLGHEI